MTNIKNRTTNILKKPKLALVDFDNTLVNTDTLLHIFKKEMYFLHPHYSFLLLLIFIFRFFSPSLELEYRSKFKKKLILKIKHSLKADKVQNYQKYLRSKLNFRLLNILNSRKYDLIVIISGSEKHLIDGIISPVLNKYLIISNNYNDTNNFKTCWGVNKIYHLNRDLPDYHNYYIELFTDSMDDLPLINISDRTFIVTKDKITNHVQKPV